MYLHLKSDASSRCTCQCKGPLDQIVATTDGFTFQPVNAVELDFVEDSIITGVSVYPRRAEITRLFKFNVAAGQNQLNISGLPAALDKDSLR